ncbi:hypothetical protein Tco_0862540 [Tanacetum coccineum]
MSCDWTECYDATSAAHYYEAQFVDVSDDGGFAPLASVNESAMMPKAQYASMPPLLGGPMGEIGQVGGPSNMLLGPQQQYQQHHYYEAQFVDVSDDGGFAPLASVNESAMMPQAQYASMPPLLGGPMGEIGQVGGPSNMLLGPQQQQQQQHYYEAQFVDVSDDGGFAPLASVNESAMMPQAQYASMPPLLGGPMGEIGQAQFVDVSDDGGFAPLASVNEENEGPNTRVMTELDYEDGGWNNYAYP